MTFPSRALINLVLAAASLLFMTPCFADGDTVDCPAGQMQRPGGWRTCIPMQGYRDIGKARVAASGLSSVMWLAIATSRTSLWGVSKSQLSKEDAETDAKAECNKIGARCTVALVTTDKCGALAIDMGKALKTYVASGSTNVEAETKALQLCNGEATGECRTGANICSGGG